MKMAISVVDLPVSQSKYQRQTIKLCNTNHSPRLLCLDVGCVSHVVRSEGIRNEKNYFANHHPRRHPKWHSSPGQNKKVVIRREEPREKIVTQEDDCYVLNRTLFYIALKKEFESYLQELRDPENVGLR
jgi:hypothetical protein